MLRILAFLVGLFPAIALAQAVPDSSISGSIAATSQSVTIPTNGRSCVGLSVTGTWTGSLTVKVSVDYSSVGASSATYGTSTGVSLSSGSVITGITANGVYQINASGFSAVQIFGTNIASGTANIALLASNAACTIMADNPFPTINTTEYPAGAIPITASATGTTAATTATLAANSTLKTYLCGFSIRANATAAATGNATVTGTATGTLNFTQWTAPLASGIGITEPPIGAHCIPSSAVNTAIAVNSAAPGSGGVVSVTAWGFQL